VFGGAASAYVARVNHRSLEEPVKDLLRIIIAAVVGAVIALAVVVGQPALASQVEKAKAKKVTSAMIKDGTIKKKDLNAEVTGPLAKADTALQFVPDNSVATTKLANNAVTTAKVADNAIVSTKVSDHSLKLDDLTLVTGSSTLDFTPQAVNQCISSSGIETGHVVTGAMILVSQPAGVSGAIAITAREHLGQPTQIDIVACNVGTTAAFDPPSASFKWAVIGNGS
jgi:hypothetical protein